MDWAVLLDLDDTLVETSVIKPLRDARRWERVYSSYHQTAVPDGAREFLAAIRPVAKLGVVTMAPRRYATTLIEHHELDVPVLVAYHDVPRGQRKPHPRPIELAAALLGVAVERTIYIGDELRDIQAASSAGAFAISYRNAALRNDPRAAAAVAFVEDWAGALAVVNEIVDV